MDASRPTYARLPGRKLGLLERGSVWIGSDHMLVVMETLTGESYRRFFFRDIQAVVITATARRSRVNVGLGVLAALNLLPLLALDAPAGGPRSFAWTALGAVLWLGLMLINTARGPGCETRIRTAAQEDVVAPLGRRRAARRTIERLRPHILEAQAQPAEEVQAS